MPYKVQIKRHQNIDLWWSWKFLGKVGGDTLHLTVMPQDVESLTSKFGN
jgi:hypothetical protein